MAARTPSSLPDCCESCKGEPRCRMGVFVDRECMLLAADPATVTFKVTLHAHRDDGLCSPLGAGCQRRGRLHFQLEWPLSESLARLGSCDPLHRKAPYRICLSPNTPTNYASHTSPNSPTNHEDQGAASRRMRGLGFFIPGRMYWAQRRAVALALRFAFPAAAALR